MVVATPPTIISAEDKRQHQLFLEEESMAFTRSVKAEGIFLTGSRRTD
jgi:hypothetical protein